MGRLIHKYGTNGALIATVDTRTVDEVKARRRAEVQATFQAVLDAGFSYDFGSKTATLEDGTTETANTRVMQIRTPFDMANWQTVAFVARYYVDATIPNPHEAMRPFRCADNSRIPMTAAEALVATLQCQAYAGAALEKSWDHKDAISRLTTVAAIAAYDITTGWP